MRQGLLILCGLVVGVPAFAAETDPCKRNRELFLGEAAKHECPEEEVEGKAIACTGTGMAAVKETRRFYELLKLCQAKPKKGAGAGATSTKSDAPAASSATSAPSAPARSSSRSCTAQARYVKAEPKDGYGFKQAVTLAVSADKAAHGLINYTISYTDKSGTALTDTSNEPYKFIPTAGPEAMIVDDTNLGVKCSKTNPCTVTGVTVDKVSCFAD
jgi:hypothetical protein